MKNLIRNFAKGVGLAALFSMTQTTLSAGDNVNTYAQKADLKVSKIATIGGYYRGTCNKVRVTVTNSQMVGVKKKIPVILTVSQKGYQPVSYVGYIKNGIGPKDNYGQSAFFQNIKFNHSGEITLKAVVNPDLEILETVYNNNTKLKKMRAPSKTCGGGGGHANTTQGYKLKVYTYKQGTWNGQGSGQDVKHVKVEIKKGSGSWKATTDHNGYAYLQGVPKGSGYTIKVEKSGCNDTSSKPYTMAGHNYGKVNMDINCN